MTTTQSKVIVEHMVLERETKGTYRFMATVDEPVVRTLYVRKDVFEEAPSAAEGFDLSFFPVDGELLPSEDRILHVLMELDKATPGTYRFKPVEEGSALGTVYFAKRGFDEAPGSGVYSLTFFQSADA